jgi:hypothetical protein
MSKFAGFIIGAIEIGIGIATGNVALIVQGGLTIAAQAIVDLTAPKTPAREASEMTIKLGEQPRAMQIGETYTPGSLVDGFDFGGKYHTDWEVLVIRLADHKCEELVGFFVNDEYNLYNGDGLVPRYDDQLKIYFRADTTNDPLPDIVLDNGPGWTSADVGESGCDVIVAYKADKPNDKHPGWPGGRPRFGFVIKGKLCYDLRKDDTVDGGAGDHRWDDPTTWEWSENPIVCWSNFERGVFANDDTSDPSKLLVGRGLTEDELPPVADVIAAANLCDEGGLGPLRYEQHDSDMPENSSLAVSPSGTWIAHYHDGEIEWWYPQSRTARGISTFSINAGSAPNISLAVDGTAYFYGTVTVFPNVFGKIWTIPPLGSATITDANLAGGGFTRVLETATGRKILTATDTTHTGYLDFGTLVVRTQCSRDFCIDADGVGWVIYQPTGSSNQFTIETLDGLTTTTFTGIAAARGAPTQARICYVAEFDHFVAQSDSKFYIIPKSTMTISSSGTAGWGTSSLPGNRTNWRSMWIGFSQYSLEDGSLIQTLDSSDWIAENVADANAYDPLNNAFWSRPDSTSHLTMRFRAGNRYRVAGPIYTSQPYLDVEQMFAAAVAGSIITREGSIEIEPAQAKSVVATFTDDDLIVGSSASWNHGFLSESSDEWLNTVVGTYVEPAQKWNSHSTPPVRDTADIIADGKPREAQLALRLVRDLSQALRIAEIARRLGRLWGRGQVTLGPRFCELEDGDWVEWQSDLYFDGGTKTLRIEAYQIDEKWQNTLTLREINVEVFDDDGVFDLDQSVALPNFPPADVGTPEEANWALAAITLDSPGASIPALEITGSASDDDYVEAIIFEYWLDDGVTDPNDDPDAIPWTSYGRLAPDTTTVDITSIIGGGTYYAAVSYVVGDELGDRLVLGPVTVADYTNPNYQEEDGVTLLLLEDDATVLSLG